MYVCLFPSLAVWDLLSSLIVRIVVNLYSASELYDSNKGGRSIVAALYVNSQIKKLLIYDDKKYF